MPAKVRIQGLSSSGSILFEKDPPRRTYNKMASIPKAHIEMHRGGDDGSPPLIIKQPVMLEPTELRAGVQRPKQMFMSLNDAVRGHLVAMIGEYLGTTMFLFFGYIAAQTANEKQDITLRASIGAAGAPAGPSLLQISYISAVFGLSLAANVWIFYRVSGGMFNPSVSIVRLLGPFSPSVANTSDRLPSAYGCQARLIGSGLSVLYRSSFSGALRQPALLRASFQDHSRLRTPSVRASAQAEAS